MVENVPIGLELIVLNERGIPCANPATKGIPVFKEIFARPRRNSKVNKNQADKIILSEFLYIYYMIDIRSFAVQKYPRKSNDEERHHLVKEKLELPKDWWPDSVIEKAAEFYEDYHITPVIKLLKTALAALNYVVDYLENVDFSNKNYTVQKVMDYVSEAQSLKTKVEALIQEVIQDINLGGRPKGGGSIGLFENAPDNNTINGYERMPKAI